MATGIVVDHKESGRRYAISEANYNPKLHRKVRDLKPGETLLGFVPKVLPAKTDEPSGSEGDPTEGTEAKATAKADKK